MTDFDPFADVPVDVDPEPFTEPEPKPTVVKAPSVQSGEGKIVHTFKEGAGFDASWTVVHANTVAEAKAILSDPDFKALLDQSKKVAAYYRGGAVAAAPANRPAPQAATAPPAGTPEPPGPDWTYKTGVGKNGKTWRAWMPPRDSGLDPVWLR